MLMSGEAQIQNRMDRMYRWTRHIYDATRKYYLLGRYGLIKNLKPASGEYVCEIGCGTARNLIKMVKTYSKVHFFGIDASEEMLKTAQKNLQKVGMAERVGLAQGFAQS